MVTVALSATTTLRVATSNTANANETPNTAPRVADRTKTVCVFIHTHFPGCPSVSPAVVWNPLRPYLLLSWATAP